MRLGCLAETGNPGIAAGGWLVSTSRRRQMDNLHASLHARMHALLQTCNPLPENAELHPSRCKFAGIYCESALQL